MDYGPAGNDGQQASCGFFCYPIIRPNQNQGSGMRATLFKEVGYSLSKLIQDIEMGEIGLPDIQRPFVWTPAKVRDLFDSRTPDMARAICVMFDKHDALANAHGIWLCGT